MKKKEITNKVFCIDCGKKRTKQERSYLLQRCEKCMSKIEINVILK